MKKDIMYVDRHTGEELQGTPFFAPGKRNYTFEGWMAMSLQAEEFFATHINSLSDFKVLSALKARLDFDNYLAVSHSDIGEALGMQRAHVSRSIKHLLDLGIIKKGPKVGRSATYIFNPQMGYKGSAKNQVKAVKNALGWQVIEGGKSKD